MMVNSVSDLNRPRAVDSGSKAPQIEMSTAETVSRQVALKVRRNEFKKVAFSLALAVTVLGGAMLMTGCGSSSSSDSSDNPTNAQLAMTQMKQVFDTLGVLTDSEAPKLMMSRSGELPYIPAKGDIVEMSYNAEFLGNIVTYTLDTAKSTSDKLVYKTHAIDTNFGTEENFDTEVTKTKDGVMFANAGEPFSDEYVVKDGYVMLYAVYSDGKKIANMRQYPGDEPGTVQIKSPDGTEQCGQITDYRVKYSD